MKSPILNSQGRPMGSVPKIMQPIGKVNPEQLKSRRRTSSGKPIIKVPAGAKLKDFFRENEDGSQTAFTPVGQNLHDDGLFHLRVYKSPTAAFK